MGAYYNEFEPYAAQWLRNLIAKGLIADGEVDERSILDVPADDLRGFRQCHFFAGLGGWPYALRLAGWKDDCEVWTGSCPCQPLSNAGKREGHADERHLWPAFQRLIAKRRPSVVFGEQVASKDGREWFAAVRADLEGTGYACGGVDLCAAGVGAPHIRQRLWWVAERLADDGRSGLPLGSVADVRRRTVRHEGAPVAAGLVSGGLADDGRDASAERQQRGPTNGFWRSADWLFCRDGKWRPVEPGTFPLAHGVSSRVGRLRAYGNAIVPQVGAEVIAAYMECRP